MSRKSAPQLNDSTGLGAPRSSHFSPAHLRKAHALTRRQLVETYRGAVGKRVSLLRSALMEAEALAWSTEFPQLFFHELALEKARSTVAWHERQHRIDGSAGFALSE